MKKTTLYFIVLALGIICLLFLNLLVGSVSIPFQEVLTILSGGESEKSSWNYIVVESRLPQAITAILFGASLSVSGLMLQTAFKNPLAGPSIFGINSGAGLGVAVVMLIFGGSVTTSAFTVGGFFATFLAAFAGAMAVMAIIFFFSSIVSNSVLLLIIGLMIGYLASSAISLLNFFAADEGIKSYLLWGMGDFGNVSLSQLPWVTALTVAGLAGSLLLIKPLNLLLLGERYAENLGLNTIRTRNLLLLITGVLTAITTAFAGPVAFVGLAVPHLARLTLDTENHKLLLPATMLLGSLVALACNLICTLPGEHGVIPVNAVTPIIGAPIIIYVIVKNKRS